MKNKKDRNDIIGKKFDKLLVKAFLGNDKNKQPIYLCQCDCGNKSKTCRYYLIKTSKYRKSCGCNRKLKGRDRPNFIDLSNKIFGCIIVLKYLDSKKNRSFWLCRCLKCNKKKEIDSSTIINSYGKEEYSSCGCERIKTRENHHSFKGYKEIFSTFWTNQISRAKKFKRKFEITIKDGWDLFIKQNRKCALTGIELCFQEKCHTTNGTASLDRIDSSKGYIKDNIQWIHKDLNFMKNDFSQSEFIDWCKLVAKNNI